MKRFNAFLTGLCITLLMAVTAFAQTPDTLTPEKKARWLFGRIRDNTVRAITPADFRNAFNSVANLAVKRTPYLSIAELRAGKADTSSVVQITDPGKEGVFIYDKNSSLADDSSMVIRNGSKSYLRIIDAWVSVKWFGAKADDSGDDTQAFQKAVNYQNSRGGGEVRVPRGNYIVNGLLLKENVSIVGENKANTKLTRNSNVRVLYANGPAYDGVNANTLPWYRINLSNIYVTSSGNFPTALVEYKGVTASVFNNVTISGNTSQSPILVLHQVWDSRFEFCEFLEGGTPAGGGSVILRSGYGYRQTKETVFNNCRWESYLGAGLLADSEANEGGKKTELMTFNNCKFESVFTTGKHVNLYNVSGFWFRNFYVTTKLTPDTESVFSIGSGQQYSGDITIYFSPGGGQVFPKSGVRVLSASYVNLNVFIGALQDAAMWAVDYDGASQQNVNFNITAPFPTVNGRYLNQKTLYHSTVRQLGTTTDAVAYSWEKSGRLAWTFGNPNNPSGTIEEFYLRAANTNFATLRSSTADPSTGTRDFDLNSNLILGAGYSAGRNLYLGANRFWVDGAGKVRFKGSAPSGDTDGAALITSLSGLEQPLRTTVNNSAIALTDYAIISDATAGNRTFTLPAASTGCSNGASKIFVLKKKDATANTVTLIPNGSETIDGASNYVLSTQYQSVTVQSDCSNWVIVSKI